MPTFETLIEPLLRDAFDLAFAMLRDRPEAEDAVQDAALSAWKSFDRFSDQGRGLRPWFLAITANRCRSSMRTRWWRFFRPANHDTEALAGGIRHEEHTVFRADLACALDQLSREQRAVLFLYYQLDLPQDEIARILQVKAGTIKSRLHRAVTRLRAELSNEETLTS